MAHSTRINKPFLPIRDQIALLKTQGLVFNDEKKAETVLKTHSYYSLVNCYCDLLVKQKSPRQFKTGASFEELMAIRDFDTGFRRFLLPQILYIEEKMSATVINSYSSATNADGTFTHSQDDYLCMDSYETTNIEKRIAATNLIIQLDKAIQHCENKDPVKYAIKNYGYVPLWMLATQMTFGQVSKLFECSFPNIRDEIAKPYFLTEGQLRTVLKIINVIRNCCAHNNVIYGVRIAPILPATLGLKTKTIPVDSDCHHKFGSVLYCLKFLLSFKKFEKIIKELGNELRKLKKALKTVQFQKVLKKMGISAGMIKLFKIRL